MRCVSRHEERVDGLMAIYRCEFCDETRDGDYCPMVEPETNVFMCEICADEKEAEKEEQANVCQ